jgi:hypothetical protein
MILVLIICSCASNVKKQKSGFDDTVIVDMKPQNVTTYMGGGYVMRLALHWDASIPADKSLATLIVKGNHKMSKETAVYINVDGEKFKYVPIDINNKTQISTHYVYMANKTSTNSEDTVVIDFYIPDNVVKKFAKSKKLAFMVNMANNIRIEETADWASLVRQHSRDFISSKK